MFVHVQRIVAVIEDPFVFEFIDCIKSKGARNIVTRRSEKNTEIDFSVPAENHREIELACGKGEKNIHLILVEEPTVINSPFQGLKILDESLFCLMQNLPWLAHTKLEVLWKRAKTDTSKKAFQAVILLAASQVKVQMNQKEDAKRLYERSLNQLRDNGIPPEFLGLSYEFEGRLNHSAVRVIQYLFRERLITDWFNEFNL